MMKVQNKFKCSNFIIAYLSYFYIGFIPKAPGTFGSLATIPLFYLFSYLNLSFEIYVTILVGFIIFSSIVTEKLQKQQNLHDPQWIVIDEVLGMLTAWAFTYLNTDIQTIFILFVLFRFFDIVKIWPASFFDKLTHGSGTILDDIISGVYAGTFLYLGKTFL